MTRSIPIALAMTALVVTAAAGAELVPPTIVHPATEDTDGDLVVDRLTIRVDRMVAEGRAVDRIRVEVVLYEPYTAADLELFESLGGVVIHTFETVSYGYAGSIPAGQVGELRERLAAAGRLCVITDDPVGGVTLDGSVQQARVRPAVWNMGYTGGSSTTIAILDTGIDDSHTDFAGRVSAGWIDTTTDAHATKQDSFGHGSHVAGIALGSGASYGVGTAGMTVTTTQSGFLPAGSNVGGFDHVEVKNTGAGALHMDLYWTTPGGTTRLATRDTAWAWMAGINDSTTSPNSMTVPIASTGVYHPFFGNLAGADGLPYAGNTLVSYNPVGDGHNLFRGMAPGATLLGVKVLLDTGSGFGSDWGAGLDWCVANRDTYSIRVINLSIALLNGATDATLDMKVNNAVANGIVVVASAANDFPNFTIPTPGNAAKAITVGAINDLGAMTNYSSNGFGGQNKPDVVAPGGSLVAGTLVTSIDTNDGDAQNNLSDVTAHNYTNLHGTSMATPMVAGLAALLIDAQEQGGDAWGSTQAEVLDIKNLILMTATETGQVGELNWALGNPPSVPSGNDPTLDRGAADLREGFGQINADAAVEAVTSHYDFTFSGAQVLGPNPTDRRAFAYWMYLYEPAEYDFEVLTPSGVDCDLYIYEGSPDADGRPVIAISSTTAGDADEHIDDWSPSSTGLHYAVVKQVLGTGSVGFSGATEFIFADGFESGDTSVWSNTVP